MATFSGNMDLENNQAKSDEFSALLLYNVDFI